MDDFTYDHPATGWRLTVRRDGNDRFQVRAAKGVLKLETLLPKAEARRLAEWLGKALAE